jgi:ketosteroid isomerase-like protein
MATGDEVLADLVNRLRRRSSGEWAALDGAWAEETIFWHAYDEEEIRLPAGSRADVSRREHEAFARALRGFRRDSTYHLSPSTDTIVEVARFSGTTGAGTQVSNSVCLVYSVEDGKIARLDIYDDAGKSRKMAEILAHSLMGDATFEGRDPAPRSHSL